MNKCDSCKHWARPETRVGFGNAVSYRGEKYDYDKGYARANDDDKLYGICDEIDLGIDLPLDKPAPLAVTQDGSGYKAKLYTQAEFGCALWAPIEKKE